ncbi:hypothetical protein VTK26DRAFT_8557 [Humicola hyalothermophila]
MVVWLFSGCLDTLPRYGTWDFIKWKARIVIGWVYGRMIHLCPYLSCIISGGSYICASEIPLVRRRSSGASCSSELCMHHIHSSLDPSSSRPLAVRFLRAKPLPYPEACEAGAPITAAVAAPRPTRLWDPLHSSPSPTVSPGQQHGVGTVQVQGMPVIDRTLKPDFETSTSKSHAPNHHPPAFRSR